MRRNCLARTPVGIEKAVAVGRRETRSAAASHAQAPAPGHGPPLSASPAPPAMPALYSPARCRQSPPVASRNTRHSAVASAAVLATSPGELNGLGVVQKLDALQLALDRQQCAELRASRIVLLDQGFDLPSVSVGCPQTALFPRPESASAPLPGRWLLPVPAG